MAITDRVHQLKVPIPDNPLEYLNAYLIKGDNSTILVDSGWPGEDAFNALEKQLAEINVALQDITSIVITHGHPDHYGLAHRLRELSRAQIIMHEIEASYLGLPVSEMQARMMKWLVLNGMPEEDVLEARQQIWGWTDFSWAVQPDRTVSGGERLSVNGDDLEVMWTPGHAPGHICLYDPKRKILFSGDHILPIITPNVSLNPRSPGNPLGTYSDCLRKMEQLEVDLVLPAHEHPFTNFRERIGEILEHHEERVIDLLKSLGDGEKTAYEIASKMLWVGISDVVLGEDLPLSQWPGAVGETLAHLEPLRVQGRVERTVRNGIAFFRAV